MRRFIIVILLLAACSRPQGDSHTIQFWQFWSDIDTKPVIEQLVKEFESENPEIKVKVTDLTWANGHEKIVISFAAHQPPDIVELGSDWIAEFAANELLADVSPSTPESYLYPARWNDTIYAYPWMLDSRYIFYNLDLFKKANHPLPRNWDELLSGCRAIDSLGDDIFGFGANSAERHRLYKKFLPFLWSNGGQVLTTDGSESALAEPQAIDAMKYYLSLCNCGLIESQRRLEEYFRDGKIGVIVSGGWLLQRLKKTPPNFAFEIAPFMTPSGDTGTSFFGGEYLSIYKDSPRKAEAIKLAEFLSRKENAQRLCDAAGFGFPPYGDLVSSDSNVVAEIAQLRHSLSNPPTPIWVDIEQDIEDAIEAAMYGHGTAEQILSKANETINAKLKSYESAK